MNWEAIHPTEAGSGTHFVGFVHAHYQQLVQLFGEPTTGGDKTDVEWFVRFDDGTVANIYNWNPSGEQVDVELLTVWHVGGRTKRACYMVIEAVESVMAVSQPSVYITETLNDYEFGVLTELHTFAHPSFGGQGVYEPRRNTAGCDRNWCIEILPQFIPTYQRIMDSK